MEPTSHEPDHARRFAQLTGLRSGTPHPFSVTAIGGGGKFTPEGTPLAFPGNTFLCHIDPTSSAYEALGTMQDRLRALPSAPCFTFLPKPSFHMTIFCGVAGTPLGCDGWPAGLPPATPLTEVTNLFVDRLRGQKGAAGMRVRAERCDLGTSIGLVERDPASGRVLRRLRDTLRDATGLDREDHHTYEFHVTLAYQTRWLDATVAPDYLDALDAVFEESRAALGNIELGPVEVCEFDTMQAFHPVALFGPEGVRRVDASRSEQPTVRGAGS
jgi:hypothetical protein